MFSPALTDEVLAEAVQIRAAHKSLDAAAKAAGITRSSFQNRLLRAAQRGIDGSVPKPIPAGQVIKGTSTLYDESGNQVLQWVKTGSDQSSEDLIAAIRSAFDEYKSASKLIPAPKKSDSDLMSVYPIADQHVGLLSWAQETGENYDLKIGADRLRTCAARLISQSPNSKQAIILNLGDWQHTDDA